MVNLLTRMLVGVLVLGLLPGRSPARAADGSSSTQAQAARSLAELEADLAVGKEVTFPIRYNSAGGLDSPRNTRIFGMYNPIYMADGAVSLTKDTVAFSASVGLGSFSVTPDKVIEVTNEPTNSSRIHLKVAVKNRRGDKDENKDFYLYNPRAAGTGDGAVGGPGASIVCDRCDNSMEVLYALLMRVRNGQLRAPTTTTETSSPSGSAASQTASAMTNDDVLQMVGAGLAESVITTAIRQAKSKRFDLAPTGLIALKKAGVSDAVIVAMQSDPPAPPPAAPAAAPAPPPAAVSPAPAPRVIDQSGCEGVENMGLYKNQIFDRAMGGGVVEWLAKIRNNGAVTRIVIYGWRDQYGQEKRGQIQVPGGAIVSPRLDLIQSTFITPIANLRLLSCQ